MKKFASLLLAASLAFSATAFAAEDKQLEGKKKKHECKSSLLEKAAATAVIGGSIVAGALLAYRYYNAEDFYAKRHFVRSYLVKALRPVVPYTDRAASEALGLWSFLTGIYLEAHAGVEHARLYAGEAEVRH